MPHRTRAIWILVCLACGFTVVSFNLIHIQLVDHDRYWKMAVKNHLRPEKIPPDRGTIFDSDGNVLAETQVRTDLRLDCKLLEHPTDQLPQLAEILGLPATKLATSYDPRKRDLGVAEDLEGTVVTKLRALKWNCLIFKPHAKRFYPNNELAAQVLGTIGDDSHGASGIEKEMDPSLNGVPGERWVELDAKSRVIAGYQTPETPAVNGYNVTLTVKMAIQHIVECELDQIVQTYHPVGAYIILMEPHTGEILAMGARPTFDPNDNATYTKANADNARNRCLTDPVEPGSIFKIITLAGALNEKQMTLKTPIFCENGAFSYGGRTLHDDEKGGFGTIPAIEVMAQSSNIGFAKIALNYLHEQKLYDYARAFGIGQRTGLFTKQGESPGVLRPVDRWSAVSITHIPMGQEVSATPIQLCSAMCVIANGGQLVLPRLVQKVTDENGQVIKTYQPRVVRQVISPEAAHDVAKALEQVTIDGTAKGVVIEDGSGRRWSFAGKTGTAQKFMNGAYSHSNHVASFIGFMPAQDPAYVALVMVDDPKGPKYYGAAVSAPVFASIGKQMAQLLNLPPDLPSRSTVLSSNVGEDN